MRPGTEARALDAVWHGHRNTHDTDTEHGAARALEPVRHGHRTRCGARTGTGATRTLMAQRWYGSRCSAQTPLQTPPAIGGGGNGYSTSPRTVQRQTATNARDQRLNAEQIAEQITGHHYKHRRRAGAAEKLRHQSADGAADLLAEALVHRQFALHRVDDQGSGRGGDALAHALFQAFAVADRG
jgi:hypothetical protein